MKKITKPFIIILSLTLLFSCGNKKIENRQLINELQVQIDSVTNQGYQIDDINIYSKTFSNHGQSDVGEFDFMFITAVPPDITIKYLANFSYSGSLGCLSFHGYPTQPSNERKDKIYSHKPDLVSAIEKLDEIKKLIPENYKYENLLHVKYMVKDNEPIYELKIELKPDSNDIVHPNVEKEDMKHVEYIQTTSRKKFGTTKRINKTNITKKTQHAITFRLKGDQIEIQ